MGWFSKTPSEERAELEKRHQRGDMTREEFEASADEIARNAGEVEYSYTDARGHHHRRQNQSKAGLGGALFGRGFRERH